MIPDFHSPVYGQYYQFCGRLYYLRAKCNLSTMVCECDSGYKLKPDCSRKSNFPDTVFGAYIIVENDYGYYLYNLT